MGLFSYSLTDNEHCCAFARFCVNGERIWSEAQIPGETHAELAIDMAHQCPAGRLLIWDRTNGELVETLLKATLSLPGRILQERK